MWQKNADEIKVNKNNSRVEKVQMTVWMYLRVKNLNSNIKSLDEEITTSSIQIKLKMRNEF